MAAPHSTPSRDMPPAGWGDPAARTGLPPHAAAWLRAEIGLTARVSVPSPVQVAPSHLPEAARLALTEVVGAEHLLLTDDARLLRAAGKSYLDLVAMRSGAVAAPDAVALPGTAEQVRDLLAVCALHRLTVVPFGGGTSVVGGVSPLGPGPVVSLDVRRLDRLLSVDPVSLVAVFEPGVRGPDAEALLAAHGLTLGHFPQSFEYATIGGFAATRSAGQASSGYGRFDEMVLGLVLQTPAGELRLGRGAATAAGPSLLGLAVGSEGAFGVITEVTVRVRRTPEAGRYEAFFFKTWEDGLAALRAMEQAGISPDVARLSDPDETRVQLTLAGSGGLKGLLGKAFLSRRGYRPGCLAILGWDGPAASVTARRKAVLPVLRSRGAMSVGTTIGGRWKHGRYAGPYLRDDLLDAGALVETLETSALWSQLPTTWSAVRAAVTAKLPGAVVMCHVSHLYPQGASLYFTVLSARSETDPVGQWQAAKDAACHALVATGATITHHHAVGADHRPFMTDEVGALGVEVLRAVKSVLDPTGILNPGKLIP